MNKRQSINAIASTMFVLLRYLIPLFNPVMAEVINNTVTIMIMTSSSVKDGLMSKTYDKPPLIGMAANARDVATPNTVAKTTTVSIIVSSGPLTLSPKVVSNVALTSRGACVRNLRYATANPRVAYVAHGCSPQWK